MKRTVVSLIAITALIISCQKKTVPVISERKKQPAGPEIAAPSATIIPDTSTGKIVFINRCGKCHGLPEPDQFTAKRWDGILSYMIPRAKLNNEQGVHVTAYLKANAQN
jgi:cytochrome c5